ncbi:MAG: hypothetical protein H6713_28005 [Myxococcales bacterium]|nr:hypothetical protein [Myxococcales bacterium]MCB9753805.1 hypothetical protein [Myxococcales bacterium]
MSAERYAELVAAAARERGLSVEVWSERRDEGVLLTLWNKRITLELTLTEDDGATTIERAALRWPLAAAWMRHRSPSDLYMRVLYPKGIKLKDDGTFAVLVLVTMAWFSAPLVTSTLLLAYAGFFFGAVFGHRTSLLAGELLKLLGSANGQALVRLPSNTEREDARAIDDPLKAAARVSVAAHASSESGKIVGALRHDDAEVLAPISGRPCVYYELYVFESKRRWHGWDEWERVGALRQREPFFIEDDSGRVRVNPTGAKISTLADAECTDLWDELPALLRAMIEDSGVYSESALRDRRLDPTRFRLRIEEGALEEGERVAVIGHAIDEPDPDAVLELGGYRSQAAERRCLVHADRAPLLISDNPACLDDQAHA